MVVQLSTRIDSKAKKILDQLHEKTRVPICVLTERAIYALKEQYDQMNPTGKQGLVNEQFMGFLDYSMRKHDDTYKKLAK